MKEIEKMATPYCLSPLLPLLTKPIVAKLTMPKLHNLATLNFNVIVTTKFENHQTDPATDLKGTYFLKLSVLILQ